MPFRAQHKGQGKAERQQREGQGRQVWVQVREEKGEEGKLRDLVSWWVGRHHAAAARRDRHDAHRRIHVAGRAPATEALQRPVLRCRCGSVLFTDARDINEIRDCIKAARPDHPDYGGRYGVANRRNSPVGYGGTPAYVQAIASTVLAFMIEKKGAVDNLEEILGVDGIDGTIIGDEKLLPNII